MGVVWQTRLTQTFGCRLPIMGAPMAGVSGGLLAAETCRAGAMGFIAAGYCQDLPELDQEIQSFRQTTGNFPLGLGFITHGACPGGDLSILEETLGLYKPSLVQFFAPAVVSCPSTGKTNIEVAKAHDAKVLVQVGSVEEAKKAMAAGVDAIIAQGTEAGGHGLRKNLGNGTLALAARLVSLRNQMDPDMAVLAAGGIVDGRGLAAALALGCDGVVLGTRLWASQEAMGPPSFKKLLTTKEPDDCLRTTVVDQIYNSYASAPWPYPFDSVGVLRNTLTDRWDGKPREELDAVMSEEASRYRKAVKEGNAEDGRVYAGEGVGDITSVEKTFDIIGRVEREAIEAIRATNQVIHESA